MKRYLLFWFAEFYPSGGWNDFKGFFDALEDVRAYIKTRSDLVFGDFQLIDTANNYSEVDRREYQ